MRESTVLAKKENLCATNVLTGADLDLPYSTVMMFGSMVDGHLLGHLLSRQHRQKRSHKTNRQGIYYRTTVLYDSMP